MAMTERYGIILDRLGNDPESSARTFHHLWRAINEYFVHSGSHSPTRLTAETMERMALLVEKKHHRAAAPGPQDFYRIARIVWKEHCRRLIRDSGEWTASSFSKAASNKD